MIHSPTVAKGLWPDGGRRECDRKQQRKRVAEQVDNVVIAPGINIGQLMRFRAALLEPPKGPGATTAVLIENDADDPL